MGQTACKEESARLYNGNLFIQKGRLSDTDQLAIEFSKFFSGPRGLDDFLVSLFDKKTETKISNLLKAKGIQELPFEEQEWFGMVQLPPKDMESEPQVEEEEMEEEEKAEIGEESEEDHNRYSKELISAKRIKPVEIEPFVSSSPIRQQKQTLKAEDVKVSSESVYKSDWEPDIEAKKVESRVQEFQPAKAKEYKTVSEGNEDGQPIVIITNETGEDESGQDNLSAEAKKEIGRWGEEYAVKCLSNTLMAKCLDGQVDEVETGFIISITGQTKTQVHWLNKNAERGEGFDIKVIKEDGEEYIEVKSTKTDSKDWFELSRRQWEFAQEKKERFHIFRIYNAGTKNARIVDIPNPAKLWREGNLAAYPIRIRI